jgi:acyl-CoA thioester hydrolase
METCRGVVYPWQMDQIGHMNVQFYTARFDEATWHLFAWLGITPTFLKENRRGMAAVDQHTQYKRELQSGALIRITSEVLEIREKSVRFRHCMYNVETGEEAASSELVAVYIDTGARRSVALPTEIVQRARQKISPR